MAALSHRRPIWSTAAPAPPAYKRTSADWRLAALGHQRLRVVARPENNARDAAALGRVLHVHGQELTRLAFVRGEDLRRQRLGQALAGVALDDELIVPLCGRVRRLGVLRQQLVAFGLGLLPRPGLGGLLRQLDD